MDLCRYPVAKRDRNPAQRIRRRREPEATLPEIHMWRVHCRPPLGCGTTAITEIRVYGPTYIFTCRTCGQPAGGLLAEVPEKDRRLRPEELGRAERGE